MAKTKAKKDVPKEDNTQLLSLSAEIAIDNLFLTLKKPTFDDVVVFATDICLRASALIKDGVVGDTEQEKVLNALALINKVCVDSVTKPIPVDAEVIPADKE